jgi:gliding motility-associated-like protein
MLKKVVLALIIILPGFFNGALGQVSKIRCTEVLPNGDVLLNWNPLVVATGFYNYTIYWSSVFTGPYNDSVIINVISQSSYIHVGAGADLAPVYYYLRTKKDVGTSPPSDTLATIFLSTSTLDYEQIDLSWTPLHTPLLPDMYPWYFLYREYPPGNWTVADSTQDFDLSHHFWSCNGNDDTVHFRIGVRDDTFGCTSYSNYRGEVMKNQSNRYPPVIDSVSIDASWKSVIGWEPAPEPDIIGYKIFRVTSTNDSIDFVAGRNATFYEHPASDPCSGPIRYIILSVDSCGNESPFPFDTVTLLDKPQSTIYLNDIQYDPCLMTNRLNWNEYQNFDPGLGYTDIYYSENGGPFSVLTSVLPGQSTFTHLDLQPNTSYSYFVRAFCEDGLKSSTSCVKSITTYNSPRPMFMYTRFVTVEDNERANILFYTDTNAHVQEYRILRGTSPAGPFTEEGIVQNTGQEFVSFSDETAEVTAFSYYYQVEVIDSCGVLSNIANTGRTILLQAEALPDLSNRLTWNAYESWSGRTLGYRVYRSLDDAARVLLADVDSLTLTYTDNVSGLTGSVSKISYVVEAYEGPGDAYGFQESSLSNEVLSEQEPRVYLPNAFAPRGVNNVLKPVCVFVGSDNYEFTVYNRWGQEIFSTQDPGEGWDGRVNGNYVAMDVYVYLVRFRNALDQPRQVKGNVLVLY